MIIEVGMPELPEVETIKNAIQKGIGYVNIINVSVNNNRFRQIIPHDFAEKITGAQIISYQRIAKYIVIGLNNGLSLIWHLGMSGRVKISDLRPDVLDKHDHVIIETSNGTLTYNDARRFGLLIYCPTAEVCQNPLLGHTGIDPFDDALDGAYLRDKLKSKTIPIKIALLDQKVISGIGNIYASEALFGAGILPTREANALTDSEYNLLVTEIRKVLEKAIQAGGSTLRDYRKPDGSLGYFQNEHCVYNKTGQRCPGCTCSPESGGGIRKITQAGRSTFYCPTKQK
ncbi:MAG: bifunctional DNA-formamidopyrimidine glycosylase/DNA-(apurinic or apyrimidinic site) lyase [Alphaproteobacteria bacterium]|nr:bifunctional DNA-formamidopyrimidine glycosylase/DNA-(apurinic or apyrimidinic site) lyase [Alphaproteobacteria bacterium]